MRAPDSTGLIELLELAEPTGALRPAQPDRTATNLASQSKEATIDRRLMKALGHPLRVRALEVLNERVASPSELARELGEPLGNVAYHVKILEENEAIELVRTAPVRGALEHFYRAKVRPWFNAIELDDEGYDEVVSLLDDVVKRAQELQRAKGSRRGRAVDGAGGEQATALMIMHVHRGAAGSAAGGGNGAG